MLHNLDTHGVEGYSIAMARYSYNEILIEAARAGDVHGVMVALDCGGDVHAGNDSALRTAAVNGRVEAVRTLIAARATVNAIGSGALREAAAHGHVDVVRCLLAAGADVHAWDDQALCEAACHGHIEVIRCLLEAGSDLHAQHNGALRWAAISGLDETARMLLAEGAGPLEAWAASDVSDQNNIVSTFESCGDAMTQDQREALINVSPRFICLRAMNRALCRRATLQR